MTFVLDFVNVGATVSFITAAADRVTTPGPFLAKVLADTEVLADADPMANSSGSDSGGGGLWGLKPPPSN